MPSIYSRNGKLLEGGDLLHHPGLDIALTILAEEGPAAFYTGRVGQLMVETVRAGGGAIGPRDLAEYRVLSVPVEQAALGGPRAIARHDLSGTIATIDALPAALRRPRARGPRGGAGPGAARGRARRRSATPRTSPWSTRTATPASSRPRSASAPACGCPIWASTSTRCSARASSSPGTPSPASGCRRTCARSSSSTPTATWSLAAGSAGGSRIRSALVHTLVNVLLDGDDPATAIDRPRFHPVDDGTGGPPVIHVEPGYPQDQLAALAAAGFVVNQWDRPSPYFGGVSAVGRSQAAGDPRRGGVGLLL